MIGLGLSLTGQRTSASLASLIFGMNEPGFTFEPWDITTLYQDRAGTTPVTAAGQSVGLRLDKSGRGNHQVAVSDAKRGVYGWMPKTGRRNLLTFTEQFNNAFWAGNNITVTPNTTISPDGTLTADTINASLGANNIKNASGFSVVAGQTYTFSFYALRGTQTNLKYSVYNVTASADIVAATTYYSQTSSAAWARISFTFVIPAGCSSIFVYPIRDTDVTGTVFLWGAQLELGSTVTAYQRVVSQYDITEAGVPTCYYVQADGVDDAYVTPTITPNTDKVQVFAGVRKLSDATLGIVAELSTDQTTNAGSFVVAAPLINATANYGFSARGSALQSYASSSGFAAPITNVLTGLGDISGDLTRLRVNGVQVGQSTADRGTGNFLAYPAYLYARGGATLPFNGLDFGHAVRFGPNLDAATIARVESLIARNTPEVTL